MLELISFNIDQLPFEELKIIKELLFFEDNPILIHYTDKTNSDILCYWTDFDENCNRWLYCKISKQQLYYYLIGSKSLQEIFLNLQSDYIFFVDEKSDETYSYRMMLTALLPSKYLPDTKSYYRESISKFYLSYLHEFDYNQKMKENSYIFYIQSPNDAHEDTVGAKEAVYVLNNAISSIEGYIKVSAFNLYKERYGDVSKINRKINALKDKLSPRIVDAAKGSLEIWLAMDTVTFNGEDELDSHLRNTLVDGYKNDVLSIDYANEEEAKSITKKYKEDEIKLIYEPIIKLIDNDSFKISITDYKKSINTKQKRVRYSSAFKDILFPKPTLEQIQEELNKKNKLYSVIINLKEGEDITKISKKELLDNMLFSYDIAETNYDINSPIVYADTSININRPLRCSLKVDSEGNLELSNPSLDLYARNTDMPVVVDSIKKQFIELVFSYRGNPDQAGPIIDELRKIL